jgi:chemotaxis protein CheD
MEILEEINDNIGEIERFHLKPGFVYFTTSPTTIWTVLGNCVAVCIWDNNTKVGGMAHIMYPKTKNPLVASSKFGNVSLSALLKLFDKTGCERSDLAAHIIGGAYKTELIEENVGEQILIVIRKMLFKKNVTIASEDTGGSMGRKVIFDTATGHIAVLKVKKIRQSDWIESYSENNV